MSIRTRAKLISLALVVLAVAAAAVPATGTVTCSTAGEQLESVIPAMGAQAGLTLKAGHTLRARRLFLFVRDERIGAVQANLAAFLAVTPGTCRWLRKGTHLVLEEDLLSQEARRRLFQKSERLRGSQRQNRFQELLAHARRTSTTGKSQVTIGMERRQLLQLVGALSPDLQRSVCYGRPVSLRYHDLTGGAQHFLRDVLKNSAQGTERQGVTFDGSRDYGRAITHIVPTREGRHSGLGIFIQYAPQWGGVASADLLKLPQQEYNRGDSGPTEPLTPSSRTRRSLARLQRRVTLKGGVVEAVLSQIAAAGQVSVLGEYDPCYENPGFLMPVIPATFRKQAFLAADSVVEKPLHEAMDFVCRVFGLSWDVSGNWIWVRSPNTTPSLLNGVDLRPPERPAQGEATLRP